MPKSPAALVLQHLAFGRVYRPDGHAIDALADSMAAKHGLTKQQVANALSWAEQQQLVSIERTTVGVVTIEVTSNYRPPKGK